MSDRSLRQILWGLAAVLLLLGAGLTLRTACGYRATARRLAAKRADLHRFRLMERELAGYLAARRTFEALPTKRPATAAELIRSALPGRQVEENQRERDDLGDSWRLWRWEIAFTDVKPEEVIAFVQSVESGRPPWTLTDCGIATQPGDAPPRITLLLEALEKKQD